MLLEKNLKRLLSQLDHDDIVQIPYGEHELTLKVFDNASKVLLSTPVYFGGNFIPSSVRKCASQKHPFHGQPEIKTSLYIDESKFKITLSYLDDMNNLKSVNFSKIIEEFEFIADEWRVVLDENDKNDLVHVHVK